MPVVPAHHAAMPWALARLQDPALPPGCAPWAALAGTHKGLGALGIYTRGANVQQSGMLWGQGW